MAVLTDRVAVVTGAGRGLGREHALHLAGEGARVVVNDLGGAADGTGVGSGPAEDVAAEIRAAGGEAVSNGDDVADEAGADRLITAALEAFGRLDILVNNAGILRDRSLVLMTADDWDLSIRVNLRGTFLPARAAARHWRDQARDGVSVAAAIINTSSESGVFGNGGQSNYAAAKAGVASLTEVWHKELFRYGVRVNAILPRARTRLTDDPRIAKPNSGFDIWDPGNVSPFVGYLATAACPISGQVFMVCGGTVQRAAPWSLDAGWTLKKDARWTVAELAAAVTEMGAPTNTGRDTGVTRPEAWKAK